jgi:hypothetical protein
MHAPQQMPLCSVHLGKQRRQPLAVINPVRPVVELPDVALIFAFHAAIVTAIRRTVKAITAFIAFLTTRMLPKD